MRKPDHIYTSQPWIDLEEAKDAYLAKWAGVDVEHDEALKNEKKQDRERTATLMLEAAMPESVIIGKKVVDKELPAALRRDVSHISQDVLGKVLAQPFTGFLLKHDSQRGSLRTFIGTCLRNAYIDWLRRENSAKGKEKKDKKDSKDAENTTTAPVTAPVTVTGKTTNETNQQEPQESQEPPAGEQAISGSGLPGAEHITGPVFLQQFCAQARQLLDAQYEWPIFEAAFLNPANGHEAFSDAAQADILGLSLPTYKSRKARVRAKLKALWPAN